MIAIDPELAAAEVLAAADVAHPPIDPLVLCGRWPRLRVSLAELDGAGYLIDLGVQGAELLLRRSDPAPRRRYTCAHELGHWVLRAHRHAVGANTPRAIVERWCDKFAAALLMPATWVIEALGPSLDVKTIASLHGYFGVSRQAALLRVGELAPLDLALATPAREGQMFAWSTAGRGAGRFDWVPQGWLREQLTATCNSLRLSAKGIELQAIRLSGSQWLVALGATAALTDWHAKSSSRHADRTGQGTSGPSDPVCTAFSAPAEEAGGLCRVGGGPSRSSRRWLSTN
jgi:hypothetical protein